MSQARCFLGAAAAAEDGAARLPATCVELVPGVGYVAAAEVPVPLPTLLGCRADATRVFGGAL
ncbi:hypothetical protein [Microbacterium sp. R86528]|uniref:hypothetical protein n=1 Tax=Microbacterium sp. R86528 TaxID=3093864 RepID=UPI0037C65552